MTKITMRMIIMKMNLNSCLIKMMRKNKIMMKMRIRIQQCKLRNIIRKMIKIMKKMMTI